MSRKSRLWLWIPWALFAAIALAWTLYWHGLAAEARDRLETWAQSVRASGGEASYASMRARGFPAIQRLVIDGFAYSPARGAWRAQTDMLELHVNLTRPDQIGARFAAPIDVEYGDGARTRLSAGALIATWRLRGPALQRLSLEADALSIDNPAAPGVFTIAKLVANARPDPRDAQAFQLALQAHGISLARPVRGFEPLGQDLAEFRALAIIEHAAALAAPTNPLEPWREGAGRARFEALRFTWGPLAGSGEGELGLDEQRRLSGALQLELQTPAQRLRALGLDDAIDGDSIAIEAKDGELKVADQPIRTLAPFYQH